MERKGPDDTLRMRRVRIFRMLEVTFPLDAAHYWCTFALQHEKMVITVFNLNIGTSILLTIFCLKHIQLDFTTWAQFLNIPCS